MAKEEKLEPIRQSVHVDCPPDEAFRLFTEHFGEWWPSEHPESAEIEPGLGGKITERTLTGERELGTVTVWEPPERLAFTWYADADSDRAGTVEIDFSVDADGTRVTVTHTNWHLAHSSMVCFAGWARELMVAA